MSKSILDKYGGEEHLEAPPRELIFAQTEEYVEYSRCGRLVITIVVNFIIANLIILFILFIPIVFARHGKLLKGEEANVVRSSYEEDKLVGNHTLVWGSWWSEGRYLAPGT